MRICFLLHQGNMYSGGQGVYLAALSSEYVERGHEVHAIVGPPYPDLHPGVIQHRLEGWSTFRLLETGDHFWRRPSREYFSPLNFYELASSRAGMFSVMSAFSLRAFEALARLHAARSFDVVHDNQSLGYGDLLAKLLGVPVVANIHHPLSIDRANAVRQASTLRAKVGRVLFYPLHMQHVVAHGLDRVITGSHASARSVMRAFRLPEDRVTAIHDGVDVSLFRPLRLERERGRVLFVGNSDDRNKGVRYLVEALAMLPDPHWKLVIVDRADAVVARERAHRLGVSSRVILTGRLSRQELAREYNRAAVFVSPSLYEGFGLPAAEAQACAAPVVATRAGALPEVVADGKSGILVPPGEACALAEAISRLLDDRSMAMSLGQEAAARIQRDFTWSRTADRTLDLYDEVRHPRR
ncbi:MAG TPA: glycosyltransferase family 4 protein [Tepidiformaceae bacterium]|nr:glycosyltransferase family 4 protein [Tepidiformaceae bacterium]